MKRKLLTLAIVSALSAACIFGVTACNKDDGGDESGGEESHVPDVGASEQINSEEEWNAAQKFKLESSTVSTYLVYDYNDYDPVNSEGEIHEIGNLVGYQVGNESYQISSSKCDSSREGNFTVTDKTYTLDVGTGAYECAYVVRKGVVEHNWDVKYRDNYDGAYDYVYPYSAFTYADGQYTGVVEGQKLTLKFGKTGNNYYLKYLKVIFEESRAQGSDFDSYYSVETSYYNINSTTYTFPQEPKDAVAAYRAENN